MVSSRSREATIRWLNTIEDRSFFDAGRHLFRETTLRIELKGMLCGVAGLGVVTLLLKRLCQPDPRFILRRVQGQRFLEALLGPGHIASKHLRTHQVLAAKARPHARILVIKRHGLG